MRDVLAKCNRCKNWFTLEEAGLWACTVCGMYDGDHHIADFVRISDLVELWYQDASAHRMRRLKV